MITVDLVLIVSYSAVAVMVIMYFLWGCVRALFRREGK